MTLGSYDFTTRSGLHVELLDIDHCRVCAAPAVLMVADAGVDFHALVCGWCCARIMALSGGNVDALIARLKADDKAAAIGLLPAGGGR